MQFFLLILVFVCKMQTGWLIFVLNMIHIIASLFPSRVDSPQLLAALCCSMHDCALDLLQRKENHTMAQPHLLCALV
jgi:hypothetical protein